MPGTRRALLLAAFAGALPRVARGEELPEGCEGAFRVDNRSSRPIRSIFITSAAASDADDHDWLGETILPPGLAMSFRSLAGPLIDLTIVRDDGRRLQRRGIEICRLPYLLVGDGAITPAARPGSGP
ncbi:hypothetical protein AAFN86_12470 [Roseomonas sp. CAU 1739]|uniref:hypothetical protein n=1 Tax=Roseomonas sp. CAU 1739 TaxID=3140364 RepID=UPI00325A6266